MAGKPGQSSDILDAVALLVIDVQPPFLNLIPGAADVVERCGFAIEAARELGLRVVFTEQVPDKLGPTDPRLTALVPGARVFAKNTFSALQAEGLLDYLHRQGIYHLLLAGIETPVCIYQSALHAHDSDFDVTVLSDSVGARRAEDAIVALEALSRANCHVLPAETVYYSMLGNSASRLFPPFNELVKRYGQPGGLDAAPPPPARGHAHEQRPRLVAPEDREPAPVEDDIPEAPDETEGEDDGRYVGRNADGAPAVNQPMEDDADELPVDDPESTERTEDEPESPAEGEEKREEGDGQPRRRPRRRRGGARRRRARERAAGQPPSGDRSGASAAPAERPVQSESPPQAHGDATGE